MLRVLAPQLPGLAWQRAAACTGRALSCQLMPAHGHLASGGKTKLKEAGGDSRAPAPQHSHAAPCLHCQYLDSSMAQDWPILYPRGLWCQELRSLQFSAEPDAPSLVSLSNAAVAGKCPAVLEGLCWQAQLDHGHMGQGSAL